MKLTSYFTGVVEKLNNKILRKNNTKYSNEYDDIHTNNNTHLNWNPNGLYEEAFDKINIGNNWFFHNQTFNNVDNLINE